MVDSISANSLENILSLSQLQGKKGRTEGPPPMPPANEDSADVSDMGQLVHAIGGMNEETQGDLKEFMDLMRNAFSSGNFDVASITSQASDKLTEYAQSQGIDLEQAVADQAEFVQTHPAPPHQSMAKLENTVNQLFKELDTDRNNTLTQEEAGISEALFTKVDQDGDGQITQEEVLDAMAPQQAPNQATDASGKGGGSGQSSAEGDTTETTLEIDTDGDGTSDTEQVTTYNAEGDVESVTYSPLTQSTENDAQATL